MTRKNSNKYSVCALQAVVREVKKGKCLSKVSISINLLIKWTKYICNDYPRQLQCK